MVDSDELNGVARAVMQVNGDMPVISDVADTVSIGLTENLGGVLVPNHDSFQIAVAEWQFDPTSRLVFDTVSEGIFCVCPDGVTNFVNRAAAQMLGRQPEELIGKRQHEIVHHSYPDGSCYPLERCPIYSVLQTGQTQNCEKDVFWRKDGSSFAVAYTSSPIMHGRVIAGAVTVFRDISEQVRQEQWQRSKDAVFQAITSHAPLNNTLQLLAEAYTAYKPGCQIAILLREHDCSEKFSIVASSTLSNALMSDVQSVRIDGAKPPCRHAAITGEEAAAENSSDRMAIREYIEIVGAGGSRYLALPMAAANGQVLGVVALMVAGCYQLPDALAVPLGLSMGLHMPLAVADDGGFRRVRDLAQIAVEHRNLQTELVHQSQHDRLTGLPNWLLMEDRLNQLILAADRNRTRIAVCSVDLDRFMRINENHGHLVGDALLQQIAARFRNVLRKGDTLGRQGGDEFIILIPDLTEPPHAEATCRKLLATLNEPFLVEGKTLTIAANIGLSLYPDHADKPELLVQHADTALNFAKEKGKGNVKLFRPDLGQKVRQQATREAALQTALERNELYLMYQPLFDACRRVQGFEALLRWKHPELGMVPPDQFIPLAEASGLILPIGDWVLREACRQAMSWNSPSLSNTKMFVNISGLQLGQSDFTNSVGCALRMSGLPPQRLELEVTESFVVSSFKKATQRLQPLQDLGISIALDDFGTGHSSFSVLHKLPINAIKVDRSFVARMDKDASGLSTVRAIVTLAHQLGMKTVAEGVENEGQFRLLNSMECDLYQGYLLSKPLTVESVRNLFAESASPLASNSPISILKTPISEAEGLLKTALFLAISEAINSLPMRLGETFPPTPS